MPGSIFICLLLPLLTIGLVHDDLLTPEQLLKLDDYIEAVMACRNVPGLTLAAVQGDKVLTRAYGKTDLEKDINSTSDSIFCIGSVTKAMTTALLSKLVASKFPETVWDTKLTSILGDSFKLDKDDITQSATLRDILCHRSGKSKGDVAIFAGYPDSITRAQMSIRLPHLPASDPFRYKFDYNNWMYFLAGYVTEVLAGNGDTWEDLMRTNIFQPLGMDSTIYLRDVRNQPDGKFALPYVYIDDAHHRISLDVFRLHPVESAGAVCTNGNDMAKWLQFLLQSGNAKPLNDLVDAKAFNDTMRPSELMYSGGGRLYMPTYPVEHVPFGYGLGWMIASYRGRHQVYHSGGFFAHTSLLRLYPELKTGLFVNINGQNDDGDSKTAILYYLADILFGEEPWLNSTTACTFPEPWTKPSEHNTTTELVYEPQRPLKDYIGIYGNQFYGDMHVFVNTTEVVLQVEMGRNIRGILIPREKKDAFSWNLTGIFWFMSAGQGTKRDRLHFYSSDGDRLDILNVSILGESIHFDRNIRFDGTPAGAASTWSACYPLTLLFVLYLLVDSESVSVSKFVLF